MLTELSQRLQSQRLDAKKLREEVAERLDAHIRDTAILKAWLQDTLQIYADDLGIVIEGNTPPASVPAVIESTDKASEEKPDVEAVG